MTQQQPALTDVIHDALLKAFGDISTKTGLAPTHLDMHLRLDDGTKVRALRVPIKDGVTGDLKVEIET